jgi:hypothetical protein
LPISPEKKNSHHVSEELKEVLKRDTGNSGILEHPLPEQSEHLIPALTKHLKQEHYHHKINEK